MDEYVVITVPEDLLPQIVRELLGFAVNPDHVVVAHDTYGQTIHAHPAVADAWFLMHNPPEPAPAPAPEPASPVAATPPARKTTSA